MRKNHKQSHRTRMLKQRKMMKQKYLQEIKKLQVELKRNKDESTHQELREKIEGLRFKIANLNAGDSENVETSAETVLDNTDDLAVAKEQLKASRKEYQASMTDLKHALQVSEAHLQSNYELISSLKHDKQKLEDDLRELNQRLADREIGLKEASTKRRELSKQKSPINVRSQMEQVRDASDMETQHSRAIQELKERIERYKEQITQCTSAMRQVHEDMNAKKAKHESLRADYKDHADRIASLTEALERCKEKNINVTELLSNLRDRYEALKTNVETNVEQQQQDPTHKINAIDSQTFHSLAACNQKCDTCINKVNEQNVYIESLEQKIRTILNSDNTPTTTTNAVRATELEMALNELRRENSALKDHIREFTRHREAHREVDEQMLKRHRKLESKHEVAMQWIKEMKTHHEDLHRVQKEIGKTHAEIEKREDLIQVSAHKLREMENRISSEQERAAKCLYPGEKELMSKQIEDLLKERNDLKDQVAEIVAEHSELTRRLSGLETDNENLRIIKQRFEMDAEQMQKIVTQTSELNVELVQTRKNLSKKEKQLELLSQQLGAMIQRVQVLEERERSLTDKLKVSTTPEDTEKMMQHLTSCRSEMKQANDRFSSIQNASKVMQEQLAANQDKITALMQVVKDSETMQAEWQKSRMEQIELQKALKQCSEKQSVPTDVLEQRIRAMEDVYKKSMADHEQMMRESNRRLAELQPQIKPEQLPMTRDEQDSTIDKRVDEVAKRARSDIASAQKQSDRDPVGAAITAANLDSVRDLQKLKDMHQASMRQKERDIMATREDVYNKLLETLNVANHQDTDPNDLYSQIKDIRTRGTAREQQTMSDMLRLRAISARLSAEHQLARTAQAELLHKANVYQRQKFMVSDSTPPPSLLTQNVKAYQSLIEAHQGFVEQGRRDVGAQMAEQAQYIRELERQYPKMDAIVASANLSRFPNLDVLRNTVDQDRKFTVGAINFERKEAMSQDRTQSALELQLNALGASVRTLTDSVKRYNQQPTTDNFSMVRSAAGVSPGHYQEELKRQAEIRDRSNVRTQGLVMQRLDGTKPGPNLAADMSTGEIQVKTGPTNPPMRFLHSSVSMFGEPTKTFAPTIERAVTQFKEGNDMIALTYSFEQTSTGQSIKYLLFKSAVNELLPRLKQLTSNDQLELQLVRIQTDGTVIDLFSGSPLKQGCTYTTCMATKRIVKSTDILSSIQSLIDSSGNESENHIVLSIGSDSTSSHIHITDVMFSDEQVPDVDSIRLLDGSWRNYLIDVLQKPNTKIDLLFAIIPGAVSDNENNTRLLQVVDRVQTYLKQVKSVV